MAKRATGFARNTEAAKPRRQEDFADRPGDAAGALHVIAIKLAPLLSPYKKYRRLSLRIERLPHTARLSAGHNNGDRSWSLTPSELDDLHYLFPATMSAPHSLGIRIVDLDGGAGTTLALLDFLVTPDIPESGVAHEDAETKNGVADFHDGTRALRDELAEVKAILAVCEADLSKTRHRAEQAEAENSEQKITAALLSARAAWKAELDERMALASAEAASDAERSREAWEAEQNAHLTRSEQSARERLEEAREHWRQETQETLRKAELAWKADTAARAEAEAELRTMLAHRESALAQANANAGEALERGRRETQEALRNAEQSWKAEAAARAEAEAARGRSDESERHGLSEELAVLRTALANRENAFAQASADAAEALERRRRETQETLQKAEQSWKADAAARFTAAELLWREQSAKDLAAVKAQCDTAIALAQAENSAAAAPDPRDDEFRRLRDDFTALQGTLTERETQLAHLRSTVEQQQDSATALSDAKSAWEADTDAQLSTAKAEWNRQSERALDQATARYKAAEAALAQARAGANIAHDRGGGTEARHVRDERAISRAVPATREADQASEYLSDKPAQENSAPAARIALRRNHVWNSAEISDLQRHAQARRRHMRNGVIAASLAAAVIFYPKITALIPQNLWPDIAALSGGMGTVLAGAGPSVAAGPTASPDDPAQHMNVVLRDANLRSGPSTATSIVSTLQTGIKVATIKQRGNWRLVRINSEAGKLQAKQGWVYSSFLSDEGGGDMKTSTGKHQQH